MKYETQSSITLVSGKALWPNSAPTNPQAQIQPENMATRVLDVVISGLALLFLMPVLVVVALAVKLQDRGSSIFSHARIGRNGDQFRCYKFRSMYVNSDAILRNLLLTDDNAYAEWQADHKLRNDPRITPLGKFLRKTSLDELPQLLNVIRGDMSLVGPRPITLSEVAKYGRSYRHYTAVQPGITGLWQVMGRNDVTYRRRVAMDRLFARKKTVSLYMKILLVTIPVVLTQRGSY